MPSTAWKGFLTFGLVSVPVRLYAAARSKTIHFNKLYRPRAAEGDYGPESSESQGGPELPNNVLPISRVPSPINSASAQSASQLSRVTQEFRAAGGENAIDPADLVQGYEYGPNQYVVV